MNRIVKFGILDEKKRNSQFGRKLDKNYYINLEEIADFGWTKNDILDKIFLVFLNMLVAPYKIS